jgi:hypothetical protein
MLSLNAFSILIALILLGAFGLFILLVRRLVRSFNHRIRREALPSDMMTDLRRNFEVMLLGSARIWACSKEQRVSSPDDNKLIVFALPTRSVQGDWLILQRMLSYVRKGGVVVFPIDLGDSNNQAEGLGYAELNLLHPVTLSTLGMAIDQSKLNQPLRYYRRFTTHLVWSYLNFRYIKRLPFILGRKESLDIINKRVSDTRGILRKAADFCEERSVRLLPIVILPECFSESDIAILLEHIHEAYQGLDYRTCHTVHEAIEVASTSGQVLK